MLDVEMTRGEALFSRYFRGDYLKHPENLKNKIGKNEFVRSKSEAIIGKVLRMNYIPFRYECPIILNGVTIYPDFTIRHPKTGETYYFL